MEFSRQLLRPLLVLLILAGAFFGLVPLLLPMQAAALFGFEGRDVLTYRLAGAATFAYAVGLAAGYRGPWRSLWIPIASTAAFNVASILACIVTVAGGGAPMIVWVIFAASVFFTASTLMLLVKPPVEATEPDLGPPDLAPWVVALFAIGVLAAAFFALGPLLLGGDFGRLIGYGGSDPFAYRQAGAATFGAALGGLLVLWSRRWSETHLAARMALTFNGLSVPAALLDGLAGGPPVAWLILVAATVVTVGMAAALARGGR